MANKRLFNNIKYSVGNDFVYEDKVEVKVFFVYQNLGMVTMTLPIDKVINAPQEYYLKEAKKIVSKMSKDGSLKEYAEKNIRKVKTNKILKFVLPVAGVIAIAGAVVATYIALSPKVASVIIPEIPGLSFSNTKVIVGQDYDTNLSVDSSVTELVLPKKLDELKSGGQLIEEYQYSLLESREHASLHIPGKYVKGYLDIKLALEKYAWYLDEEYLSSLKGSDVTKEGGEVQTITINKVKHKVHLVGVDQDVDINDNKIHTTWEFVNPISDENGLSIATQWNDTNNAETAGADYLNSTIRKALNGTGNADHFLWSQAGENGWSDTYTKPVIDMLPKDFVSALKAPKKYATCYNSGTSQWEDRVIATNGVCDKLFLPSLAEIGWHYLDPQQQEHQFTYSYYLPEKYQHDLRRVKPFINEEDVFVVQYLLYIRSDAGQEYSNAVINRAGYTRDESEMGAMVWYRSPNTNTTNQIFDLMYDTVTNAGESACACANCVAPMFCL